jgi:flagellar hook-basal body complex protein FliE
MVITPVEATALTPIETGRLSPTVGEPSKVSFESVLGGMIDQVNRVDIAATQKAEALASGAIDDVHGTMISVKEAEISVRLAGTVRNKLLDAFQELWRTSV